MKNLTHYLIVDDDMIIGRLLAGYFSRKNIHAMHVPDPIPALEYLEFITPELIISDYHMPGMTGIEMLKAARAKGNNSPFLFMSGDISEPGLQKETLLSGIYPSDFLAKPFTWPTLEAYVERALINGSYRLDKASSD